MFPGKSDQSDLFSESESEKLAKGKRLNCFQESTTSHTFGINWKKIVMFLLVPVQKYIYIYILVLDMLPHYYGNIYIICNYSFEVALASFPLYHHLYCWSK